jgi:arylsulfatase
MCFRFFIQRHVGIRQNASALLCLLLAGFLSCSGSSAKRYNVIIISVDTLRADHLHSYGYPRETDPNIQRLAARSFVFDNAVTPKPKTNPSFVSMLTGLYPVHSGVRQLWQKAGPDLPFMQSLLKQQGYLTAAFAGNPVLAPQRSGMGKDFDIFDLKTPVKPPDAKVSRRKGEQTNAALFPWLEANHQKPFFLWVHYMDVHGPYRIGKRTFSHEGRKMVPLKKIPKYQQQEDIPVTDESTDLLDYVDRYDDGIAYVDQVIGKLIEELDRLKLFDNSIVIFNADHGEGLGEHEYYLEHGREYYEPTAHIPLFISLPPSMGYTPRRIHELVSIIDIAPTIYDWLNITPPRPLDGVSLRKLITSATAARHEVFIENYNLDHKQFFRLAVRTRDFKFGRRRQDNRFREECFDLRSDPQELNQTGCPPAIRTRLKQQLEAFRKRYEGVGTEPATAQVKPLSDQEKRNLRGLGYLQ